MFNALLLKVSYLFQGELFLVFLRTFLARGIAALGVLLLVLVVGRLYGPSGVGVLALAQSLYLGAGILSKYGMDNAIMRYVGQAPNSIYIKTYLFWGLIRPFWLSLVAALSIYLLRAKLGQIFSSSELTSVLTGISVAIPSFTLAFVLAGFMKGVNRPATACLLENGSISLVASILLLLMAMIWPDVGIALLGWAFALAAWLVLAQGAWQLLRWLRTQRLETNAEPITEGDFQSSSRAFLVLSLAQFMQQVVVILIAGWLLSGDDLGLFRSAERVAFVISFVLLVVNAIFPPRFARLFYEGNYEGLSKLARQGALLGIVMAFPIFLIFLLFPAWVLSFVGKEFNEAAYLLQIMAVAQLVNVATGSVAFLLNMTGHEKLMRNISLACNVFGLVLLFVMIPFLGVLGAALSLTIVLVLQNLIALVYAWKRLGIWMLPLPNVLFLMGMKD